MQSKQHLVIGIFERLPWGKIWKTYCDDGERYPSYPKHPHRALKSHGRIAKLSIDSLLRRGVFERQNSGASFFRSNKDLQLEKSVFDETAPNFVTLGVRIAVAITFRNHVPIARFSLSRHVYVIKMFLSRIVQERDPTVCCHVRTYEATERVQSLF